MKKLLLSLGAIAAVVTPIASVVACGAPAKPAPIALDKTKVEAMLPQIKTALIAIASDKGHPEFVPDIDEGTVSPDGDNFDVTFVMKMGSKSAKFTILVSPSGEVEKITTPTDVDIPDDEIKELKALIKGGTVDHSQDTAAIEYNLVKADYDQDIVGAMDLEFPTIVASPSNDEMRTYNKETEAFLAEYNELAGNAAYEIMNGPIELTWTEQKYFDLELPSGTNLDEDLMNDLHMPQDVITKLMKLINGKVTITVHKIKTISKNAQNLEFYIHGATTNEGGNTWFVGENQITFA